MSKGERRRGRTKTASTGGGIVVGRGRLAERAKHRVCSGLLLLLLSGLAECVLSRLAERCTLRWEKEERPSQFGCGE
jgi:hypothetical protein